MSEQRAISRLAPPGARRTQITLFTDAGFCPEFGIGVWAAWAKVNGVASMWSGVLRKPIAGSTTAEIRALANGISMVIAVLQPNSGDHIIAQSDCVGALDALSGRQKKRLWRYADEIKCVTKRIAAAQVTVEYRHVPGHKGTSSPRQTINTWCDKQCRRLLKAERARVRQVADQAKAAA